MEKNAVVSLVIGEKYGKEYDRYFLESHKKYADKIGADFIVIREWIEESDKHPTWQKLLMFRRPELKDRKQVMFIDADIFITKHAESPFPLVPADKWGAVKNNIQNIPRIAESDLGLFFQCPPENRPNFIINSGFIVFSPIHQPIMEKVYKSYKGQSCGEQGPISYHLLNEAPGEFLPWPFNAVIPDYLETRGWKLSSIVSLYEQGYFIHSAGGMNKTVLNIVAGFDRWPGLLKAAKALSKIPFLDRPLGFLIKMLHALVWRADSVIKKFS